MTETPRRRELPPIPSELYSRVNYLHDRAEQLQREITAVRAEYDRIDPGHVTTDHFGEPITRDQALDRVRAQLDRAQSGIDRTASGLDQAQTPASRLLTTALGGRYRDQVTAEHTQTETEREQPPAPRRGIQRDR